MEGADCFAVAPRDPFSHKNVQGKESPRTKSILSLQLVSSHMLFIAVDLPSHAAEDNRRSFGGD
jgi:hypothetical protein